MNVNTGLRIIAIILLFILGAAAISGGALLIMDSSGQKLGIPIDLLDATPFKNYLIPGIILFVMNGVLSFFVAIITWLKKKFYARVLQFQGYVLICWLTIELLLNPDFYDPFLHFTCYSLGVLLLILGFILHKRSVNQ